jgi:cytidine deaminase
VSRDELLRPAPRGSRSEPAYFVLTRRRKAVSAFYSPARRRAIGPAGYSITYGVPTPCRNPCARSFHSRCTRCNVCNALDPHVYVRFRQSPAAMTDIEWDQLRAAAREASRHAYAPYSRFPVGAAALVDDGRVVIGCNVENASLGATLCAECGLVSALHASGGGRLVALACVDGAGAALMPCGRCRQLLWEHGGADCLVDTPSGILPMSAVLPQAFGPTDLTRRRS